jgi:hypothetical protein
LQTFSSGIFFKQLTATEQERAGPSHSVETARKKTASAADGEQQAGLRRCC